MSLRPRRLLRPKLRPARDRAPQEQSEGRGLRAPREELAEATAHGQVYLRRLQRAQLSLSLLALIAFGAVFGVLPLALYLLPVLHDVRFLDIPVALWILVIPMLPIFVAIGWLYARRSDALDDAFTDVVER